MRCEDKLVPVLRKTFGRYALSGALSLQTCSNLYKFLQMSVLFEQMCTYLYGIALPT